MALFSFQILGHLISRKEDPQHIALIPDQELQKQIDSLKQRKENGIKPAYSYNPNYLTDYQGYLLGLTPEVIDKVWEFRENGNYFRSETEFQTVTGVSDSLFAVLSPRLRFPKRIRTASQKRASPTSLVKEDLNAVDAIQLQKVRGIGDVLSARIIKFRKALGGFLIDAQLYDVYGLDSLVAGRVLDRYTVRRVPDVKKLPINSASKEELAANIYITYRMASEIISYRERSGPLVSWDELRGLESVPADRIDRIRLYLSLEKKLLE